MTCQVHAILTVEEALRRGWCKTCKQQCEQIKQKKEGGK